MRALRAPHCFDGVRFLPGGATVVVDGGRIQGIEPYGADLPESCHVTSYDGTLLPGLVDVHTHLVTDSGLNALDRVAAYSPAEIEAVIVEGLRRQLASGVTTVRDLGDRDYAVVEHRDRQRHGSVVEPRIVAFGPPLTSPGGHCHYLGGEVDGPDQIRAAVRDRVERGADGVKVMASGGVHTPGTDVTSRQFTDADLRLLVDEAHAAGLPVTAHAHALTAVRQAVVAGVEGIEHCSCVSERGFGDADDVLLAALADSGVAVCPTLGLDHGAMGDPPPSIRAMLERLGTTLERMQVERAAFVARLHAAGVRLVSGVDSGIQPPKAHGTLPFAVVELADAGIPASVALASATSDAAQACGLEGVTGRLAAGLEADLLAVDGDLSEDLGALHRPLAVVRGGTPAAVGRGVCRPPSPGP
ncbi:MAG TPA: amidohydrolase family protein [Nocardioidaceae bacterium]|nr:amidohydrolase family protein [Nocardioidaceae bacterium]